MTFKELICNLFECQKESEKALAENFEYINRLSGNIEVLNYEANVLESIINSKNEEIEELADEVERSDLDSLACQEDNLELRDMLSAEKSRDYTGKLTTAKVQYGRRLLVAGAKTKVTLIDVRNFITPNNFWIYDDIKKAGLFIQDSSEIETKAVKLYYLAKKDYKYVSDKEQFGIDEVWLFPFELHELKKDDCEGWSALIGSYFACAGLPRDRWWISAGNTRQGGGHATVYVRDDSGQWRHLNSTNQKIRNAKTITDFPKNTTESDKSGIAKFWFSFNDFYSVTKFEDLKDSGFYESDLKDKIVIREGKNV